MSALTRVDPSRPVLIPAAGIYMPGPIAIVPDTLPLFQREVDCNQFADDRPLYDLMDESRRNVWAANSEIQCTHVNFSVVTLTGRPLEKFLDFGWNDLVHPEGREDLLAGILLSSQGHEEFCNVYRLLTIDNCWAWVIDRGSPRLRPDGSFAGYVGTLNVVGMDWEFARLPAGEEDATPTPTSPLAEDWAWQVVDRYYDRVPSGDWDQRARNLFARANRSLYAQSKNPARAA